MEVPSWGNIMWWIILMWLPLLCHCIVTQWMGIAWGKPASGNTVIPGKIMSPFTTTLKPHKTYTYLRCMKDASYISAQPKWWRVLVHTNYDLIKTKQCKRLYVYFMGYPLQYIDGLVQERRNSNVLAMELRFSYINPSMSTQGIFPMLFIIPHPVLP